MAENAGHLAVIENSLDDSTYVEIDGEDEFSVSLARDPIEVTNFKDATASKIRIMGLRDGYCDLGGNVVFRATTFEIDQGFKNLVTRLKDGAALFLRTKLDGSGGTYRGATTLGEEFTIAAEVSGAVTWSAKTCLNGAAWA